MKKIILIIIIFLFVNISINAQIKKRNVDSQRAISNNISISGTITLNTDRSPTVCTDPNSNCANAWNIYLFEVIDPEQGGTFINTNYTFKSLYGKFKYSIQDLGNRTYAYTFSNVPKNIKTIIAFNCSQDYGNNEEDPKMYADSEKRKVDFANSFSITGAMSRINGLQTNQNNLITMVTNDRPSIVRDITISNAVIQEIH